MYRDRYSRRRYGAGGAIGGSIGALAGSFIPIPGVGTAIGGALGKAAGNAIEKQFFSNPQNNAEVVTNSNINSRENQSLDINPYGNSFGGGGNLNRNNMTLAQYYESINQRMPSLENRRIEMTRLGLDGSTAGTPEGNQKLLQALQTANDPTQAYGDVGSGGYVPGQQGNSTILPNAEGTNYSSTSERTAGQTTPEFDNTRHANTLSDANQQYMDDEANWSYGHHRTGGNSSPEDGAYNAESYKQLEGNQPEPVTEEKADPTKWVSKLMLMPNGREKSVMFQPSTGDIQVKRAGQGSRKLSRNNVWYGKDSDAQGSKLTNEEVNDKFNRSTTYEEKVNKDGTRMRRYKGTGDNYEYYVKDDDKKKWENINSIRSTSRYAGLFGGTTTDASVLRDSYANFAGSSATGKMSSHSTTGNRTTSRHTNANTQR